MIVWPPEPSESDAFEAAWGTCAQNFSLLESVPYLVSAEDTDPYSRALEAWEE